MKKITFLFLLSILCLIGTTNAQEAQSNRFSSLAEAVESGTPFTIRPQATTTSRPVIINATGTRASLPYLDRASFQAACGSTLPLEDFAGGPVGVGSCGNIISSMGDACYPSGEILPGVEITSNNPANTPQATSASTGTFGNSDPTVGSNYFIDFTVLNFPNMDVTSVGFDLYTFTSLESVDVRVFGTSGLIDTYTVAVSNPTFLGIIADETITSIEIEDLSLAAVEHIAQLEFGTCALTSFTECGTPLGQPIPTSGTAGPMTPSIVSVPDCGIVGANYNIDSVDLDLNHTFDGDLTITLTSPSGTALTLADGIGSSGDDYTNTVFMDGNPSIVTGTPPYTGTFQPEGGTFAAVFGGENIQGAWILNIQDNLSGDSGVLNNFCFNYSQIAPNQPPVITCPTNISVDNSPGECGAFVSFAPTTATDPEEGSIPTIQTAGLPSGSLFLLGINTVEYTATDSCGETVTCTFTITVNDTENPVITCPANITANNDIGVCGAAVNYTMTTSDNCPGESLVQTSGQASGTVFPLGTTTNTFIVTDANGNTATCSFDITVEDNEDPVWATAPVDMTIECDGTPDPSGAFAAWLVSFSGTDNCGTATVTNNSTGLSDLCGATGTETVTFTLDDGNGNVITQDATFTIEDTTDPLWAIAPSDMTIECDGTSDPSGAFAAWLISFSGTDNCGAATVTNNSAGLSDLCGATGTETVTFTLTDECGNDITMDATFTIEDTTAPTIVCSMDVNITTDPGVCGAEVDFPDAVSIDTCSSVTVVQTAGLPANSFFPVGVSTIEFTATDECGNASICSFTITITDNEPAIAVCQDITIQLDEFGNASIVASDIDGGSTDNCGVASISASQTDFDCSDVGDNNITLTVTDVNGNTSTCIAVVTVEDVTLPIAVCQDITVALDANGNATITGMDIGGASTDACGIVSYDIDIDTFDCSNIGDNLVTLIVTDPSGNTATCTATVTIEDITAPVLVCADVTLELGSDGTLQVNPEDLLAYSPTTYNVITISSDNGSNAEGFTDLTVTVTDAAAVSFDWDYTTTDGPAFDSFGILLNGVYTELSDPNGTNTQSGTSAVNVAPGDVFGFRSYSLDGGFGAATTTVSNFLPGFTGQFAPANWTEILINSDGSATFVEIPGGPLSFDACGITVLAVDVTEVTCADIGTPIVITVFASDASGNIAACQATVTVVDLLAPELTCPADQTQDPGAGNVLWEVPDYFANGEATATDNCTDPVVITTQDPAAGTLLPDGVYTVTMTAEDEYGNIATCDFELIIESQLGVGDHQDLGSVILYPNPANNIVRLSNPDTIELESIYIYDLTGRLVNKISLETMGTEISIDVSRFANATYMVIIKGIEGTITKQLIVNNY